MLATRDFVGNKAIYEGEAGWGRFLRVMIHTRYIRNAFFELLEYFKIIN